MTALNLIMIRLHLSTSTSHLFAIWFCLLKKIYLHGLLINRLTGSAFGLPAYLWNAVLNSIIAEIAVRSNQICMVLRK